MKTLSMAKVMAVAGVMGAVVWANHRPALAQREPGGAPPPPPAESRDGRYRGPTLTVVGTGEAFGKPDRAVVRIGAVAQSRQAAAAQQEVSETVTKTIEAIKAVGIDEKAIRTAGVSLHPVYTDFQPRPGAEGQPQEPKISGYRASNSIEVRVDDLSKLGPAIDAGVGTGANTVEGVTFELKDDQPQRKEALKQAAEDARGKAEALAAAMGMELGGVLEVIEGGGQTPPIPFRAGRMALGAEAAMATPIQPGELEVNAAVTITYRLGSEKDTPAREKGD